MTAPAQIAESATPKVPPRPAKLPRGRPRAHRLSAEQGIAYLEQVAAEQSAAHAASCARASAETAPSDPTAPAKRPRGRPRKARPVTPISTAGAGTQPAPAPAPSPAVIPIPSITPERLAHLTDLVDRVDASEMLLSFMRYCWRRPHEPLLPGPHTIAIAKRIDKAVEDYAAGKSTYLEIVVPFRHGKSDLASRYLPAWFLGRFPDAEVMSTAYAADLSQGFSRDVKSIINDERYSKVFPGVELDTGTNNASERRIAGRAGRLYAVGRGGAAAGRGCSLLIVDDMIKNREEADSAVVREAAWRSLTDDFMTRLAPVHIVLIVNTRWHVDDICGRIHERTDPKGEHYDAAFPSFERLHYSARVEGGGYLHEARFGRSWYEAQYATLGPYGSAALLDGEPVVRGGNFLQTDRIQWVDEFPAGLAWVRCWDLASTEKEVAKSDPDWTVGARVAVAVDEAGAETLCVDDVVMIRAEASRRNALIKATARRDAAHGVPQWIEAVAGYKDSYTTLRDALAGVAVVSRITLAGDKVVRAGRIEPHFAAGRVMMRRGAPWKAEVVKQLQDFPSGRHDDVVDAISSGYVAAVERAKRLKGLGVGVGRGAR